MVLAQPAKLFIGLNRCASSSLVPSTDILMNVKDVIEKGALIYECISGSAAYGTWIDGDSIDTRGVFIENANPTNHVHDIRESIHYYQLGYFFDMLKLGDWKVFDMLYTQEHFQLKTSRYWQKVIDNIGLFISKDISKGLTINAREFINNWEKASQRPEFVTKYRKNSYKQFRADHDIYRAYHGYRSLVMGINLLELGSINVKLKKSDRDFMISIKEGKVPLKDSLPAVKTNLNHFNSLIMDSSLAPHADG